MGRGHLLESSISPVRTLPKPSTMLRARLTITKTATTFRKNRLDASMKVYYRKSAVLALILTRSNLHCSGDRGQLHVSSYCEQHKPWQWPAIVISSVHVYKHT